MTLLKSILLGVMVAWTSGLVFLGWCYPRDRNIPYDETDAAPAAE
jgi:hypothetical protein